VPLGQPTPAFSPSWLHSPASPGLKAHGRSRGGVALARWRRRWADSGEPEMASGGGTAARAHPRHGDSTRVVGGGRGSSWVSLRGSGVRAEESPAVGQRRGRGWRWIGCRGSWDSGGACCRVVWAGEWMEKAGTDDAATGEEQDGVGQHLVSSEWWPWHREEPIGRPSKLGTPATRLLGHSGVAVRRVSGSHGKRSEARGRAEASEMGLGFSLRR
jgi:hypothetical protein